MAPTLLLHDLDSNGRFRYRPPPTRKLTFRSAIVPKLRKLYRKAERCVDPVYEFAVDVADELARTIAGMAMLALVLLTCGVLGC